MTTAMKPMEALKSAYCLSNKGAALVLDMIHGNFHGQASAEICVDIFGPQGLGQAKVLAAYNAFVQKGKEAFWADAFASANRTAAAVAHIRIPSNSGDGLKGWTKADDCTQ